MPQSPQEKAIHAQKEKPQTLKEKGIERRKREVETGRKITEVDKQNLLKNQKISVKDDEGTDIPDAPYYVTLIDKFLSDFRNTQTQGKSNRLVIPAKNLSQAELIRQQANKTPEFKSITITDTKPRFDRNKNFVQVKTREKMPKLFRLADSQIGVL